VRNRRAAIVTGASSGIGRALALRAARRGYDVLAVGRRAQRLEELEFELEGARGRLVRLALDLREPGAPARIVRTVLDAFGRIDVLVNNAGGVATGPIAEQSDEALDEQVRTHVTVPLALLREALPALRRTRGQVFFVGSGVARVPVGGLGAYPPVKAAVRNLTRIARNELRRDGIAVTYVDPGAVASEFMTRAGFAGPPRLVAASPDSVARAIFDAFRTRRYVVNAVPWQTFAVALGEALPGLADFITSRAGSIVGTQGGAARAPEPAAPAAFAPESAAPSAEDAATPQASPATPAASVFEAALEPLAAQMKRSKFRDDFVRALLVPGAELETGHVAAAWAGMPNKHERRITHDVLEALTAAAYLSRTADDRYRVERAADV